MTDSEGYPTTGSPGLKGHRQRGSSAVVKHLMIAMGQQIGSALMGMQIGLSTSLRAQRSNPFFLCLVSMDCFAALAMTL
jgi:hypothetical protein